MNGRLPILTLVLAVLSAALLPEVLAAALQYDRAITGIGGLLRMLSSQWTHWSINHWAWDAAVFVALGAICEWRDRRQFVATLALSMVAVPVAVHLFCPGIHTFRGLSGIDSALLGLLMAQCLADALRARNVVAGIAVITVLLMFVAKLLWEVIAGMPVFAAADAAVFVVVPAAHLVGFLCGVIAARRRGRAVSISVPSAIGRRANEWV